MNVTMQIERVSGKNVSSVYVYDTGHDYDLPDLDRVIVQLRAARRWLAQEPGRRGKS